jgi:hypothetical protein
VRLLVQLGSRDVSLVRSIDLARQRLGYYWQRRTTANDSGKLASSNSSCGSTSDVRRLLESKRKLRTPTLAMSAHTLVIITPIASRPCRKDWLHPCYVKKNGVPRPCIGSVVYGESLQGVLRVASPRLSQQNRVYHCLSQPHRFGSCSTEIFGATLDSMQFMTLKWQALWTRVDVESPCSHHKSIISRSSLGKRAGSSGRGSHLDIPILGHGMRQGAVGSCLRLS